MKADCRFKDKEANVVEESKVGHLFMPYYDIKYLHENIWLVNRGCSNHMTRMKDLFTNLDETEKMRMNLGDDKETQVTEKGTVALKVSSSNVRFLNDVQYVPTLAHNLLSVGQLLSSGYNVTFQDE